MGEVLWLIMLIVLWPLVDLYDRFLDVVMTLSPSIRKNLKAEQTSTYFLLAVVFLIGLVMGTLLKPLGEGLNLIQDSIVVYWLGVLIAVLIYLFKVDWVVLPLMIGRSVLLGCFLGLWIFEIAL